MNPKFDIFDMHTGRFVDLDEDEYDEAYIQFLKDLDTYKAENDILYRILSQKYHTHEWETECMD